MDVWHDVSAGNTAFAVSAFLLTQRHEIGRREIVDIDGLKRTAAVDMAFLQPAIAALRSGKKEQLMKFDDLLYGERYRQIQKLLGIECAQEDGADEVQEFEEIDEGIAKSEKRKQRRGKAKSAQNDWSKDIPMRDPLVL
jgi:hypothetical protein